LAVVVALAIAVWQWHESERSRKREDARRRLVASHIVWGSLSVVVDEISRTLPYTESIDDENRIRRAFTSLPLQALVDHLGQLSVDIVERYFWLHNEIENFKKDRLSRTDIKSELEDITRLLNRLLDSLSHENPELRAKM
jgi:hypothetical protein